jgi:hypothetical protein
MAAEYVGLIGIVLGAGIAAGVSWLLNLQMIKSEGRQWMRNARQQAYVDFLSAGTSLHRACKVVAESTEPDRDRLLATPTVELDKAYVALQTISDKSVFLAAREYNSWFGDLRRVAGEGDGAEVKEIGRLARIDRHACLAAVRRELRLPVDKELLPEWRGDSERTLWQRLGLRV